jgi:flagellar hook protein FlgE
LVLANFPNIEGLQKYKGSTFVAFSSSGEPSIGVAGSGGRGSIVGSALEQSNVDMAAEFVNLIKAQRAYQANSRIISTTDELYQDSLNLKR